MKKLFIALILFSSTTFSILLAAEIGTITFEPDANSNQIRDDMEDLISNFYPDDEKLREFFLDYTRVFQEFVKSHGDKGKSIEIEKEMNAMITCLREKHPDKTKFILAEIRPNLLKTYELSMAYLKADRNLIAVTGNDPSPDVIAHVCSKYF